MQNKGKYKAVCIVANVIEEVKWTLIFLAAVF